MWLNVYDWHASRLYLRVVTILTEWLLDPSVCWFLYLLVEKWKLEFILFPLDIWWSIRNADNSCLYVMTDLELICGLVKKKKNSIGSQWEFKRAAEFKRLILVKTMKKNKLFNITRALEYCDKIACLSAVFWKPLTKDSEKIEACCKTLRMKCD